MATETDVKKAEISSAFAEWRAVPAARRRAVLEAAGRGERHEGAEAQAKGERFAQAFYERQELRKKGARSPWLIIAMFLALLIALTPGWQSMPTEALIGLIIAAVVAMVVIVVRGTRQERQSKLLLDLPRR